MLVNRTELREALNLSKGRISQLEKAKVLRPTKGGKFDLEKAQSAYLASLAVRGAKPEDQNLQEIADIARVQLERQQTRLTIEKIQMELASLKMEIQRGIYVHLERARQTLAFLVFPLQSNLESIVAKFASLFSSTHQQAVEVQQAVSANIRWKLFGKLNTRDLNDEKNRLMAGANAVLADSESSEAARLLATDIKRVYELIDPSIIDKLGIKTFGVKGNLASPENSADNSAIDSAVVLFRDHDQPDSPLVIASRSEDRITFHADQATILQLVFAMIGYSGSTTFRTPVVMSADLANIKFESKIGDAKMPPKYKEAKK
jgi:hypothetical protein